MGAPYVVQHVDCYLLAKSKPKSKQRLLLCLDTTAAAGDGNGASALVDGKCELYGEERPIFPSGG